MGVDLALANVNVLLHLRGPLLLLAAELDCGLLQLELFLPRVLHRYRYHRALYMHGYIHMNMYIYIYIYI